MAYPIVDVVRFEQIETLGTKEKFWFRHEDGSPWLFKAGRRGTGENWAEKATCELAILAGLPCAHYDFAVWENLQGVVTPSFISQQGRLVLGNEVLARVIRGYEPTETYRAREYRLSSICALLRKLSILKPPPMSNVDIAQMAAPKVFTGYLVFDCWIGNPDRHHENWGFIVTRNAETHLAPTYDHASGLGVRLLDEKRQERLTTKDSGFAVESYVEKARTPFRDETGKKMFTLEVVRELAKIDPGAVAFWVERLVSIPKGRIEAVFAAMPEGLMTPVETQFATRLLDANRRRLEEIL